MLNSQRPALRALPAALALIGLLPTPGSAAVHLWTGASSANWSNAANWAGGLPPPGIDTELVLDAASRASTFNDIAGGFVLNRLTLGAGAAAPTLNGQALHFQGAGATLRMLSNTGHAGIGNALVLGDTLAVAGGPSPRSLLYLQGAISGSGGLQLNSGTTVVDNSANSWTGMTRIEAGATLATANSALSNATRVAVAAGGELQLIGSGGVVNAPLQLGGLLSSRAVGVGQVNSTVTLTDAARIRAFNASALVLTNTVNRAGHALTLETVGKGDLIALNQPLAGQGDVLLTADNGGELRLGTVLGSGDIRVSGIGSGSKVALGAIGSDGGSGLLEVAFRPKSRDNKVTMKGVISGPRELRVSGGTLDMGSLAHSFSGPILLSSTGEIQAFTSANLGSAANTLRFELGGRLVLTNGGGLMRDIVTTGGMARVEFGQGNNTVSSTISGDGGISFSGFVMLTGNNSFAGGLGVFGTASFNHDGNLGAAGQGIDLGGGLALPAGYDLNRPLTLSSTSANLSGSGTYTITSTLSGDGRLNLGGPARYVLAGSASHTGGVALAGPSISQAAVLVIDSDARLGAAGGVLNIGRIAPNNVLASLPGTLVAAGNLDIAATRSTTFRGMTVDTKGFDVVFNQPINGLGMTKAGAGTWTLNTANSNTSGDNLVQVLQGKLALGADEALGTRSLVSVASGAQLALVGRVLTVTSLDSAAGSTVDLGAGGTLRPLFGTLNGTLDGQGSLVIGRAGFSPAEVSLNGDNRFAGTVEVTNGSRLAVGHANALGAAGNLIRLDNGTLEASGTMTAPLVISDATRLQIGAGGAGFVANGQSIVIERALTGPLNLRIQGGSRPGDSGGKLDVRLANRANSFTGDLLLGDPEGFGTAVLGITADGSLGAASNRLVLGSSFFDGESTRSATGGLRAWDSLTLAATRKVLLDGESDSTAGFIDTNGHTLVVAGRIGELQSGLGLLKTGEGTLVLNGQQAYSGLTTVEAGTLGGHGEVEQLAVEAATLSPGESAGLFSVRQGLSFSSGALLSLELGGLLRGSGYDALNVGGSADLGGDTLLSLTFIDGFVATAGQQFQLIQADGGLFGHFANVADGDRLLTADGSGSFLVHYGKGQGLVISDFQATAVPQLGSFPTAPVPEPGNWALMLGGLYMLARFARRKAGLA